MPLGIFKPYGVTNYINKSKPLLFGEVSGWWKRGWCHLQRWRCRQPL